MIGRQVFVLTLSFVLAIWVDFIIVGFYDYVLAIWFDWQRISFGLPLAIATAAIFIFINGQDWYTARSIRKNEEDLARQRSTPPD